MLEALNVMQYKNILIAVWKLGNGLFQGDAVNDRHAVRVRRALDGLLGHLARLGSFFVLDAPTAEVHEDLIDRQAMEPGRECRIAAEAADLAEKLDENLLGKVFSLGLAAGHAERKAIGPAMVALVDHLERGQVAVGGQAAKIQIAG